MLIARSRLSSSTWYIGLLWVTLDLVSFYRMRPSFSLHACHSSSQFSALGISERVETTSSTSCRGPTSILRSLAISWMIWPNHVEEGPQGGGRSPDRRPRGEGQRRAPLWMDSGQDKGQGRLQIFTQYGVSRNPLIAISQLETPFYINF